MHYFNKLAASYVIFYRKFSFLTRSVIFLALKTRGDDKELE